MSALFYFSELMCGIRGAARLSLLLSRILLLVFLEVLLPTEIATNVNCPRNPNDLYLQY